MTRVRRLELTWSEHQGRSCLRVRGWTRTEFSELGGLPPAELAGRLVLLPSEVLEARVALAAVPPIAGRWDVDQDSICFVPRFPFLEAMGYSLLVYSTAEGQAAESPEVWTIQRPASQAAATTEVVAIYPSGDHLPVNQLKLYIHFSSPMSEGWVARAIQARRADNDQPLQDVFLAMEPELWDPERCRLTLLLDPGRIKRGLAPHQETGYPLIEGVPVIVTIAADFRDAAGQPLRTGAERRYQIGPPLRVRVSPAKWRYHPPAAGSMDSLTVEFDRPLDHALLQHGLWVDDAAGLPLAGRGSVDAGERCWRFRPESAWAEGQHQVVVDPRLEDLAGNSLTRVFDRDLMKAEDAPTDARRFAIDFTCAPPSTPARHVPTPEAQKLSWAEVIDR